VYTSYNSAELINGKRWACRARIKNTPNRYRLMWMDVKYEPGTVKVVAYDANGKVEEKEIKRQVNHTRLFWMQTENHHSRWRGYFFVTVSVVDKMSSLSNSNEPVEI
jgi:beta-galactosidase